MDFMVDYLKKTFGFHAVEIHFLKLGTVHSTNIFKKHLCITM